MKQTVIFSLVFVGVVNVVAAQHAPTKTSVKFQSNKNVFTTFVNPSFEGKPGSERTPMGWYKCASTPDVLPLEIWNVTLKPDDGQSYVGLTTKPNGSCESIGQYLQKSLPAQTCFTFTIDVAKATNYAGHHEPVVLQVWGGSDWCQADQLLFESPLIVESNWKTIEITFKTTSLVKFIQFRAAPPSKNEFKAGNILIDHCGSIETCRRA